MIGARFSGFAPATPDLLGSRELLRRIDSKFVVPVRRLDELLARIDTDYAALQVPTGALARYESLYFDTPSLRCFDDHRRGRRLRHKVRIRDYPDRGLTFLEVKTKRNETVTDKHRLPVPFRHRHLGDHELAFLREHVGEIADTLRPELVIHYRRASLIGFDANERVTIDLDMSVEGDADVARRLGELAVIEVKQSPFCVRTPIMRALAALGIRQRSLSKYVTALALTRPDLRRNRILPDLRALERMYRRG